MDFPRHMISATDAEEGATWECGGKVSRKYIEDRSHKVDLEVWVKTRGGEITTPGSATAVLPHHGPMTHQGGRRPDTTHQGRGR